MFASGLLLSRELTDFCSEQQCDLVPQPLLACIVVFLLTQAVADKSCENLTSLGTRV